jgi:hypothetical protein
MAITILKEPTVFWPICNDVEWNFDSTNYNQTNFSFIVELYINGSLHSTHEVYPEAGGSGRFNISTIGRAVVTSNICAEGIQTQESYSVNLFRLKVYEKYGAIPVIYLASVVDSSLLNFINGAFRFEELYTNQYDYTDYNIQSGTNRLFLTDWPRAKRDLVAYKEGKFLSIIDNKKLNTLRGFVNLYDINNTLLASANWTLSNYAVPMSSVGPSALVGFTTLVQADFNNCYYYTIQIKDVLNQSTKNSEIYTIYYDTSCSSYERMRLHWMNRFGAWDSFTFTLLHEHSTDIASNRYTRSTGRWALKEGVDYIYNRSISDGQQMTMSKFMTDKLILNSDWIHEDVQQWLVRSLYESPRVYLETETGQTATSYEPVNVTNANYILKQRRRYGLMQELVQIERTYTKVSQLG